jgi:hypothetical protein
MSEPISVLVVVARCGGRHSPVARPDSKSSDVRSVGTVQQAPEFWLIAQRAVDLWDAAQVSRPMSRESSLSMPPDKRIRPTRFGAGGLTGGRRARGFSAVRSAERWGEMSAAVCRREKAGVV